MSAWTVLYMCPNGNNVENKPIEMPAHMAVMKVSKPELPLSHGEDLQRLLPLRTFTALGNARRTGVCKRGTYTPHVEQVIVRADAARPNQRIHAVRA